MRGANPYSPLTRKLINSEGPDQSFDNPAISVSDVPTGIVVSTPPPASDLYTAPFYPLLRHIMSSCHHFCVTCSFNLGIALDKHEHHKLCCVL